MKTSRQIKFKGEHFDLILNTHTGAVTVQQKWKYTWLTSSSGAGKKKQSDWTYEEKKSFHQNCDAAIWRWWNNHYKIQITGEDPFAQRFKDKELPLNFDLRWVMHNQHYSVWVTKGQAPYGENGRAWVKSGCREIWLWVSSTKEAYRSMDKNGIRNARGKITFMQIPVIHEFGHTLNYGEIGNDDEYTWDSPFCEDRNSIMNWGWELRGRHIRAVLEKLNDEFYGLDVTFKISKRR